jgi:co-chaperonin GroES (HSP10)
MKTLGFYIYFTVEKETEDEYVMSNGVKLWLDTEIDRARNARQYGTVKSVPENLNRFKRFKDEVDIKEGDKIWFHHFVVEESSKIDLFGENVYMLPYEQIFAVEREGELLPTNDFVFIKPDVKERESSILHTSKDGELSKKTGTVVYTCKDGERMGLDKGDRIFFKSAPYDMDVNGEKLYRLRADNILAKLHNGVQL